MGEKKSEVAIIDCRKYKKDMVDYALSAAVELLGGWKRFVHEDEKIILKPNLLARTSPENACTTHPRVFAGVGALLKEAGYEHLCYGDSPGNHLIGVEQTAEGCGLRQEAEALGIKAANFSEGVQVAYPDGHAADHFVLCKAVLEADAIINLCKMKTHQLERITGAMKNTFGCVYGFNKGASHARFPNADAFGKMIADLNRLVRPRLHIMDGVIAMEGNGPQSGDPTPMYVIMASADPVALDSVFCRLVNLDPKLVPTNVYGQKYGIGTYEIENIEILTEMGSVTIEEAVSRWGNPDFNVERASEFQGQLKSIGPLQKLLDRKPFVRKEKCIGCGICIQACPLDKKAIFFKNGKPAYHYKKCIKCYCCQEMCPEKAIDVRTTWLAKLADRNWRI